MSTNTTISTVALAAAALFLGACSKDKPGTNDPESDSASEGAAMGKDTTASTKKIKCFGVNTCSGQSACDVPDGRVAAGSKGHACAGQNECAKKGWIQLTASECTDKGGEPM